MLAYLVVGVFQWVAVEVHVAGEHDLIRGTALHFPTLRRLLEDGEVGAERAHATFVVRGRAHDPDLLLRLVAERQRLLLGNGDNQLCRLKRRGGGGGMVRGGVRCVLWRLRLLRWRV